MYGIHTSSPCLPNFERDILQGQSRVRLESLQVQGCYPLDLELKLFPRACFRFGPSALSWPCHPRNRRHFSESRTKSRQHKVAQWRFTKLHIPDAPCIVYLPTKLAHLWGKCWDSYSSTMEKPWVWYRGRFMGS